MPSVDLVVRHKSALLKLATQVDAALRNGREGCLDEALSAVDAILFEGGGIARDEMASARTSLHKRRQARARSPREQKVQLVPFSSRHDS